MSPTQIWHTVAAIAAFTLVTAGCQPDDPYQDTRQLPTSDEQREDEGPVVIESIGATDPDERHGSLGALPLDERARARDNAWTDASDADYRAAVRDCERLDGTLREDCIEQVDIGFRAARVDAQNPAELEQLPLPSVDPSATADASDEEPPGSD